MKDTCVSHALVKEAVLTVAWRYAEVALTRDAASPRPAPGRYGYLAVCSCSCDRIHSGLVVLLRVAALRANPLPADLSATKRLRV